MATIVAAADGGNWTATATWVGGVVPTAADDVQLTNTSGSVTIDTNAAVCRSLDCTGYTGTLVHTAAMTLTIGDGTAGAGNVALKLAAGMTYTLGSTSTSAITFASTSATQQTITTGGKTLGTVTFSNGTASYLLADANTCAGIVNHNGCTLNTNNQTCNWAAYQSNASAQARTLTLGSSAVNITQAGTPGWEHPGAITITANTATLTFTGAGTGIFDVYGKDMNGLSVVYASGSAQVLNGCTVANFTFTGTAIKTATIFLSGNMTVTGTLTINGNSAVNRVLVYSNVTGTARTISAGALSCSNVDFTDIAAAGAASWNLSGITGGSGDGCGNTGITFTASTTQTWQGTAGGNWSDVSKWTSRVPLSQDTVTINAAFTAGQTVSADMPRLGRDITWTGVSGSPIFSLASTTNTMYGSLTLASGMTMSGTQTLILAGRGSYGVTTSGVTFTTPVSVTGTTYTLQDAFTSSSSLSASYGTLNTNNQTVTCTSMSTSQSSTLLALGNSIINLTSTAAGSLFIRGSGSLTAGSPTINVVNASANARSIAPQGIALANATINYTVPGSTGSLAFSINSAFNLAFGTINFSDTANARTLIFPATNTTTVNTLNVTGSAGKLMSIVSSTASSTATLIKTSGYVSCDYVSVQDITASGGASWYAGANSTNVSNNSGWFFQAYSPSKFMELL